MSKNFKQFDSAYGRNPRAVAEFLQQLDVAISEENSDRDVCITIGEMQLLAYDHAALINGIYDAVQYYLDQIS